MLNKTAKPKNAAGINFTKPIKNQKMNVTLKDLQGQLEKICINSDIKLITVAIKDTGICMAFLHGNTEHLINAFTASMLNDPNFRDIVIKSVNNCLLELNKLY